MALNVMAVLEAQQLSWESRRTQTEKLIEQLNLGHVRRTLGYALSGGTALVEVRAAAGS